MLTVKDMDGVEVGAGDVVAFNFGIPPQRVECRLGEHEGSLWFNVISPDHVQPRRASLRQMQRLGVEFHKVGKRVW